MSLLVAMQTLQTLREEKLSMNLPIACAPRLSSEKGPKLPRNTLTWPSKWNCTPRSYKTKAKYKMSDIQNMKMMSISSILAHAAQCSLSKQLSDQQGIYIFFIHFYHTRFDLIWFVNNDCKNNDLGNVDLISSRIRKRIWKLNCWICAIEINVIIIIIIIIIIIKKTITW